MEIVKQLASKLHIQLASKLADSFADLLRLHLQIFFVVKPCLHTYPLINYVIFCKD